MHPRGKLFCYNRKHRYHPLLYGKTGQCTFTYKLKSVAYMTHTKQACGEAIITGCVKTELETWLHIGRFDEACWTYLR